MNEMLSQPLKSTKKVMTSYNGQMGGSPLSIAGTKQLGLLPLIPPSPRPCSTTSTTSFSWNTVSSIPEMIGVNGYAYLYAGGLPTEQIGPNGSVLYYLEDRQGSTIALTDQQGHVVARYSYSPYGTLICGPNTPPNTQPNQPPCHPAPPTPPAACPPPSQHSPAGPPPCLSRAIAANHFLYDGQYLDTISGLYYLRARWYDPATGQFTSIDALVAITGQPYSYAGGNPVNASDPTGMNWLFSVQGNLSSSGVQHLLNVIAGIILGGSTFMFMASPLMGWLGVFAAVLWVYSSAFLLGLYEAVSAAEATAGSTGYVFVKVGIVATVLDYYGNYLTGFWGPIPYWERWLVGAYVGPQFNVQAEGANNTCINAPILAWVK